MHVLLLYECDVVLCELVIKVYLVPALVVPQRDG